MFPVILLYDGNITNYKITNLKKKKTMSLLIESLQKEQSEIRTENGAKTFSTSLNANLDLFFMGGAFRNRSEDELIALLSKAIHENKELALKIIAYIRDCRGGMGERRFFRVAIKYLISSGNEDIFNIELIPELGRWDDLFELYGISPTFDKKIFSYIERVLFEQ